ncbi:MAG: helicase-exonuclease AddAB subunit AddA [Clostridiales bacterium]|nr:helicase-exonuclease AddAB subunit AddA [Clostridiales bacterium]
MTKWTEEQQNAIGAAGRNILVSAAAGSGKTAVLSERVVKMITDPEHPVDIDSLLVVTFTNAAAAQMKSRIASSLEKAARMSPKNRNIRRQMMLLPSAKICTIDSFCINLVRENFFKLDISRDFGVLDSSQAGALEDAAVNKVLDNFFELGSKDFISLYELMSSPKNDSGIISAIKELHRYIYAQPLPYRWLSQMIQLYNPETPFRQSVWWQYIKDEVNFSLTFAKNLLDEAFDCLDRGDEVWEKYLHVLESDRELFDFLSDSIDASYDSASRAFSQAAFKNLPAIRNYSSPMKTEIMKKRSAYKAVIADIKKNFFVITEAEHTAQMEKLYPIMKMLESVVKAYDEELISLKAEKNSYTFSDIEHFAIELLVEENGGDITRSETAKALQNSFSEILVDEYQDTNEAQDLLFSLLSNGQNLFMVGDVKQSIYRFRLAMPHIFINKKNSYQRYAPDGSAKPAKIILDKNFRSRKGICDYVNFMFSNFMSQKAGEIDYNEDEFLNCGADYKDSPVPSAQIKIFDGVQPDSFDETEAQYIAKTILSKISAGEEIKDGDTYRKITFSDFAVLFRSAKKHIGEYAQVFMSYGIPVVCDNSANLFENGEIILLLSFLKVINNPLSDIDLLSVMLSPLYSFSPQEIAQIKIDGKAGGFHRAVLSSDSEKVRAFLAEIERLGRLSVTMSVSAFIRYICEYKSILAFTNALANGEQRRANINKFIEFAESFDSGGSFGLASFLRLADRVAKDDRPPDSAEVSAAGENAVLMMSVHRSKGLEFPVVIYAGTARKYVVRDSKAPVLLNPTAGIGVKIHNEEGLYRCPTAPWAVINKMNRTAALSENLRVLYVAMTRAKEQFISFVSVKDLEKTASRLAEKISGGAVGAYQCRTMTSDSDYIIAGAMLHKSGEKLRALAEINLTCRSADFALDIEVISSTDEIENQSRPKAVAPNESIVSAIKDKLNYKYEHLPLATLAAKRTASSLDEAQKGLEYFCSARPAFMEDGKLTPGEKGTAMHAFMQFCSYTGAKQDLENEIKRLTLHGFISEIQASSLDRRALHALFFGDFAKRIFSADRVYRELKVTSFESVRYLDSIDSDEQVLVQGIADCVFEENGRLILVDYKTDRVKTESQLISIYKNQLAFYKRAVEKTLKKEVAEAYLYSFALGKAVEI